MNSIPTAEILLENYRFKAGEHIGNSDYDLIIAYAIEFAKLHSQATAKAAVELSKTKWVCGESGILRYEDIELIYPLTNIK